MIQLSDEPKPASAPVSGWMKPITIGLVPPLPEVDVEPPLAPLMLELQASSSPPPPTTAALAPAVRSRPRRLSDAPKPPRSRGDVVDPGPADVLSGCAVWSLMCNRSPFEVAPMARDRI